MSLKQAVTKASVPTPGVSPLLITGVLNNSGGSSESSESSKSSSLECSERSDSCSKERRGSQQVFEKIVAR